MSTMRQRLWIWLGAAILSIGLAFSVSAVQAAASASATQGPGTVDETYTLGSGDKVRVTVFGEADLGGEFVVDSTGNVQLPLIGQIHAAGDSVKQFEKDMTTKLQDGYLKDPRVSVEVINYRPFYIIGEVAKPGEYQYVSGMNVLNAVALAGGYTFRANDSQVYVRRSGSQSEVSVKADQTSKVFPGDIIRVGERFF